MRFIFGNDFRDNTFITITSSELKTFFQRYSGYCLKDQNDICKCTIVVFPLVFFIVKHPILGEIIVYLVSILRTRSLYLVNCISDLLCIFTFHVVVFLKLTIVNIIREFFISIVVDIDIIDHRLFRCNVLNICTSSRNGLQLFLQKIISNMRQIYTSSRTDCHIINMLTNIRKSFILIRTRFKISKEIQKNIVAIQRYNHFINFRSLYFIGKALRDFNSIFDGSCIGCVHNICIHTHAIIHRIIV